MARPAPMATATTSPIHSPARERRGAGVNSSVLTTTCFHPLTSCDGFAGRCCFPIPGQSNLGSV